MTKKKTAHADDAQVDVCGVSLCMKKMAWIFKLAEWKLAMLEKLVPFINILPRVVVAEVFWSSGVLKLPAGFLGVGKGNWDNTLLLFEYEYQLPVLSPQLAAYMGTAFEIICPVLLVLGLGSRAAAGILLIMTAVIEFGYQHSTEHVYWATLLCLVIIQGPGKLSVDCLIRKKSDACPVYSGMVGRKSE